MHIGKRIQEKRKARKFSQEYLAEQLGVTRQAVSKWETGQSDPTAKNLMQLAKLLEVPVSELLGEEAEQQTQEPQEKKIRNRNLQILALSAYTGSMILGTIRTSDRGFYLYANCLVFLSAIWMAWNISRLPREKRKRYARMELIYCVTVYLLVTLLTPRIGNVYTAVIVAVCCVIYGTRFRFREQIE